VDIDIDSSHITKEEVKDKGVLKDHLVVKKKYSDGFKTEIDDYEILYDADGVKVKYKEFEKLVAVYEEGKMVHYSAGDKVTFSDGSKEETLVLDKNNHTLTCDYFKTVSYEAGKAAESGFSGIYVDGKLEKSSNSSRYSISKTAAVITEATGILNSKMVKDGKIVCCVGQVVPSSMPTGTNKTFYDKITVSLDNGLTYDSTVDNMSAFKLTLGASRVSSGMTGLKAKLNFGNTVCELRDIPLSVINHDYGAFVTDKNATCESAGSRHRTCGVCGYVATESVSATGHNYGGWTTIQSPNCVHQQIDRHVCQNPGCGHHEDHIGEYGGHSEPQGAWSWVGTSDAGRRFNTYSQSITFGTCAHCGQYICNNPVNWHPLDWKVCECASEHQLIYVEGTTVHYHCRACGASDTAPLFG